MYFSNSREPPPQRKDGQKDDNRPNLETLTKTKDYFVEQVRNNHQFPVFCTVEYLLSLSIE